MSSDQQLDVNTTAVNDLCQNKHNDNQQCEQIESLVTVDNSIATNKVLENDSGSESSQCNKVNGQRLKINDSNRLSPVEENVNIHSNDQMIAFDVESENTIERITQSDEKYKYVNNDEDAVCHNNGTKEEVELTSNSQCRYDDSSPTSNNKAISEPVSKELPSSVDEYPNDSLPQVSSEPLSDISNEKQQQNSSSTAEDDNAQQSLQHEISNKASLNENIDLPNVPSEGNDKIVESTAVDASTVDDDEIEQNDECTNDENENDSIEHDSNEDSSEFPDIVDFDSNNEVENDEYILDTVIRKPRKERRRIVSINDDESDPEIELERERLLPSPTIEEAELTDTEHVEENIDIELLIRNEKPGPKSKKISTQKLKELQARELLRNAVVIPSSSKKKKSRIFDSDDDDEKSLLPYCVDVDDIGMPDTTEDNDNEIDTLVASSILLNDIEKTDATSIENSDPITSAETIDDVNKSNGIVLQTETRDENAPVISQNPENIKCSSESLQETCTQSVEVVPEEEFCETETAFICDSGNSIDSTNQQCRKENEINTVTTGFPLFPSSSSSENEDEFIPNEVYFGTPDNNYKRRYFAIVLCFAKIN